MVFGISAVVADKAGYWCIVVYLQRSTVQQNCPIVWVKARPMVYSVPRGGEDRGLSSVVGLCDESLSIYINIHSCTKDKRRGIR